MNVVAVSSISQKLLFSLVQMSGSPKQKCVVIDDNKVAHTLPRAVTERHARLPGGSPYTPISA